MGVREKRDTYREESQQSPSWLVVRVEEGKTLMNMENIFDSLLTITKFSQASLYVPERREFVIIVITNITATAPTITTSTSVQFPTQRRAEKSSKLHNRKPSVREENVIRFIRTFIVAFTSSFTFSLTCTCRVLLLYLDF